MFEEFSGIDETLRCQLPFRPPPFQDANVNYLPACQDPRNFTEISPPVPGFLQATPDDFELSRLVSPLSDDCNIKFAIELESCSASPTVSTPPSGHDSGYYSRMSSSHNLADCEPSASNASIVPMPSLDWTTRATSPDSTSRDYDVMSDVNLGQCFSPVDILDIIQPGMFFCFFSVFVLVEFANHYLQKTRMYIN